MRLKEHREKIKREKELQERARFEQIQQKWEIRDKKVLLYLVNIMKSRFVTLLLAKSRKVQVITFHHRLIHLQN